MLTHGLGVFVRPRTNESPDQAIRRFMRLVRESKVIDEFKSKQHPETRGERRRRKWQLARHRSKQKAATPEERKP